MGWKKRLKKMMKEVALGVDIGGTGTEYGLVTRLGEVVYERTVSTKSFSTPNDLIAAIYSDLKQNDLLKDLEGIGIGAPNGNYFNGTIEFAPNLSWQGIIPLAQLFSSAFGVPAWLTNDANAAAIGEMLFGNAQDLRDFVTVTLGTGVGSGIVINGDLVYGHDGFAGEYGHIRVIPNGRLCGCQRYGCLETYCSSTGVVRSVTELDSENKVISSLSMLENPSAKDVFEHADRSDLFANEIVDFTANLLGSALADYTCFSSPKAYVLFGGIAQHGGDFATKVKRAMEENMLVIYKNKVEIRVSALHDRNAAVLGSAALLFKHLKHA